MSELDIIGIKLELSSNSTLDIDCPREDSVEELLCKKRRISLPKRQIIHGHSDDYGNILMYVPCPFEMDDFGQGLYIRGEIRTIYGLGGSSYSNTIFVDNDNTSVEEYANGYLVLRVVPSSSIGNLGRVLFIELDGQSYDSEGLLIETSEEEY